MFTSLNVVNMAVSFLEATKRLETVLRKLLIFSLRAFLPVDLEPDCFTPPILTMASSASNLVILPLEPVPLT